MIRKDRNFSRNIERQLRKLAPKVEEAFARKIVGVQKDLIQQVQKAMDDVIYSINPVSEHAKEYSNVIRALADPDTPQHVAERLEGRKKYLEKAIPNMWIRTRALRDSVQFIQDPDGNIGVFAGGELLVELSEQRLDINEHREWPPTSGRNYAPYTAGNTGEATTFSGKGWYDPARELLKYFLNHLIESGHFSNLV